MGLGVFAKADIKRGTTLLVESPLLCGDTGVYVRPQHDYFE